MTAATRFIAVGGAVPAQAGTAGPSAARFAKTVREQFLPAAHELAGRVLGGARPQPFRPAKMSKYASWFTDSAGGVLVVVMAPAQLTAAVDEVFAHGLSWQQDRDLVFVVPAAAAEGLVARLPWIQTPCRVFTYDSSPRLTPWPIPARDQVLANYGQLKCRTLDSHVIKADQLGWITRLLEHPALADAKRVDNASYVSWHHRGLRILKVTSGTSLRVAAGVQYTNPPPGHRQTNDVITGPLSNDQLQAAVDVITDDRAHNDGKAKTNDQAEHRLQAALQRHPPKPLGLVRLRREFPGWRGPGRPGYIDFLGMDGDSELHVVETKIGHDPRVLVQALDYAIWVHANDDAIRGALGWPTAPRGAQVHLDLVLAGKGTTAGVNPYLPGQLEALAGDVRWRVFTVTDAGAEELEVQPVSRAELWTPAAGRIAKAVCPPRWSARVETALRHSSSEQADS